MQNETDISSREEHFSRQTVPLSCEQEKIHIINRIQACGCLVVIDVKLVVVQCSSNAVSFLSSSETKGPENKRAKTHHGTSASYLNDSLTELDGIIGKHLNVILNDEAVEKVRNVIQNADGSGFQSEASRNFLVRCRGTFEEGQISCSVVQSGEHFVLELENIPSPNNGNERDTMMFMEGIAKELRKCWSIEEMASLVCSRMMAETPYDRGMVYRFDHDGSGEVIFESFRHDAKYSCKKDSFLGLRFPASDIPRQARELFMKNTLRFIFDVNGVDSDLYPSKIQTSVGCRYTDLSMCRLRGSSYMHLKYLSNMKVTSSMVIAIIVNKQLWGLYSFHGYRQPLKPSSRTRFLCEMASIVTSMVMESLIKASDHRRLMEVEKVMQNLHKTSVSTFVESYYEEIYDLLDVSSIAFRISDPPSLICYGSESGTMKSEIFDCLLDVYGNVCKDYGVVFIDDQESHPLLVKNGLKTFAFFRLRGLDVLLVRRSTVEKVHWGGDPDKKLEPDGTLTPRNSFAAYVKNHIKIGRPWGSNGSIDKQLVNHFVDQIEKHHCKEVARKHTTTIESLREEKKQAIEQAKENFDFFAHMAHELRTPFHGVLGSLEAMREDPNLANNELLKTAELSGKNMIRILDDILLIAKGSYNLELEEQSVDSHAFLKQTISEMTSYAYMEGVSISIRKEDILFKRLLGDFNRIRQVISNLLSNAIKFSNDNICIEMLQRRTFLEVISVWKTYANMYANCQPSLRDIADFNAEDSDESVVWIIFSVVDKGIGIAGADLKRLGSAFTQLSSGRQKKYQGTGLGINICNLLVTALQGKLAMFSALGFGSCFTFAVPVNVGPENSMNKKAESEKCADDKKESLRKELQADFTSWGLSIKGLKILVVDDSKINRKLCKRKALSWLPWISIVECSSGKSCLDEFRHDHQSILGIIMDYHMHGMDGDECTRTIREYEQMHENIGKTYIAGYTADILEPSLLLKAGMDSVIPKPEPDCAFGTELRKMMERYLKNVKIKPT